MRQLESESRILKTHPGPRSTSRQTSRHHCRLANHGPAHWCSAHMKATKLVRGVALMAGVIPGGLFADDAAKHITYTDSAKVPAGTKPEGAVYTFVAPADPAVKDIAQAGYRA